MGDEEYEPELYRLEHVYYGITDEQRDPDTGRLNIIGAFFVNKKSSLMTKQITFGLIIKDEGRRLVMNDPNYEIVGVCEFIGQDNISETENLDGKKSVKLSAKNKCDFEKLLKDNSKLRKKDKNKYGMALRDYANNKKYALKSGAIMLMHNAAQAHLAKKYNSGFLGKATKNDRKAAGEEYVGLSTEYRDVPEELSGLASAPASPIHSSAGAASTSRNSHSQGARPRRRMP